MKIYCEDIELKNLLLQYFSNIEFVSKLEAKYQIILEAQNLNIQHESKFLLSLPMPTRINLIINFLAQLDSSIAAPKMIGPVAFNPEKKLCLIDCLEIQLTDKEVAIINFLLKQDREVTKEVILAEVWGYSNDIATNTLETHIYRLRTKLQNKYDLIISNELGYKLNHEKISN